MNQSSARRLARPRHCARLRRRALAAALAAAFSHVANDACGQVLPSGAQVVNGTADISRDSERMVIRNSPNAILNWQSFSIGAQNTLIFLQDNANSKVLNRVLGNDPSNILGSLSSNGQVWLVNPNGVLFGAGSSVNVSALVASTLGISNQDFLAGRFNFGADGVPGRQVENQGKLNAAGDGTSSLGGHVWLIGGSVQNDGPGVDGATGAATPGGIIQGGQILLAAAKSISLVDSGAPNITVRVSASGNDVVNLGQLLAPNGGSIDLHGFMVNQNGIVRATSLDTSQVGHIVIHATSDASLGDASETSASGGAGAAGGQVVVESDSGTTSVQGKVLATSDGHGGGQIQLLGANVQVGPVYGSGSTTTVDASGADAGGQVLIGTPQANPNWSADGNQGVIIFAADVKANATGSGNGGSIIARSNGWTNVQGNLEAKGGPNGGRGGTVEMSGSQVTVDAAPAIDGAAGGDGGALVLAANDIAVQSADCAPCAPERPQATNISNTVVRDALLQGARVRLEADGTAALPGNLAVYSSIDTSEQQPAGAALTLAADNDVSVGARVKIGSAGNPLPVSLIADRDAGGAGAIRLGADAAIATAGGEIRLGGGSAGYSLAQLVALDGNHLDAGGGNLYVNAATLTNGAYSTLEGSFLGISGRTLGLSNLAMQASGTGAGASGSIGIAAATVNLADAQINADNKIQVIGSSAISLDRAHLSAAGAGDAITLSTASLATQQSTLTTPYGHWLAYLQTVGALLPLLDQSLDYTFVQVGMDANSTPAVSLPGENGLIVRAPMNVLVSVDASRAYDGTAATSFSTALGSNLAPQFVLQNRNDGVTQGHFADKNAGIGKSVFVDGAFTPYAITTSSGRPVYGANQTYVADIAQRYVTANVIGVDKVYDGTRTATVSGTVDGAIAGDDVRVNGAAARFDTKDVGTGKAIGWSGNLLAGSDAGNYAIDSLTPIQASITPRPITLDGVTALDKVYDGSRTVLAIGSLSGVLAGDAVDLRVGDALFADKNAGTAKTVLFTGIALTGADAANYALGSTATLHASITPRPITLNGITALDKVYDGSASATLSGSLTGLVAYDSVGIVGASGRFSDKNAGVGKTVSISGATLTGADAANYVLGGGATVQASITPRQLTLGGLTALDKVYDGNRAAIVSAALTGALPGDAVSLTTAGQFDTKNVGAAKSVTISGALGGADAANYSLSLPTSASAAINARPLEIVLNGDVRKEYDATSQASLAPDGFALTGIVAGDSVAVRGPAQGSFASADVGRNKRVSVSGVFQVGGADAANYRIGTTELAGASTAIQATVDADVGTVTPATLVYAAAPATGAGSLVSGPLSGTVTGFKGGDTLASATTGSLQWNGTASPASGPGLYAVNGSGLSAANYVFVQAPGNATALELKAGLPASAPQQRAQDASAQAIDTAVQAAAPAAVSAATAQALSAAVFDRSTVAPAKTFAAVRIGSMNQDELANLIAYRKDFKRKLFADAVYKLTIDPSLADVRPCSTAAEAASGVCRITPAQVAALQAKAAPAPAPAAAGAQGAKARVVSLPRIERKIAVLFGVNDYTDKNIPPLLNAVSDADALGQVFADKLGYEVQVVRNPDKATVFRTLNALAAQAGSADSVAIYYAGHGYSMRKTGAGFWLPADTSVTDPKSWISNADIAQLLSGIRSKQVTLISDSCYSGVFAREGMDAIGQHVTVDDVLAKRSVVVLSSGGDEPVPDSGKAGHSIFTWHLMQVIGSVTNWEQGSAVFSDVQARVKKEFPQTPKYGSLTAAGHQAGGDYLFESRSN